MLALTSCAIGPHGLVAGRPDQVERVLRTSWRARGRLLAGHLTFVLIDFKGGVPFDQCRDTYPHTVGMVAADLDGTLVLRRCSLKPNSAGGSAAFRDAVMTICGSTDD